MRTQEELKKTIDEAQADLNSLMQATQLEESKRSRLAAIESARRTVERTDKEIENFEQKIKEAAQKLDDAIKARFLSRQPYVVMGVSTPVNNLAQVWIGLKDGLVRKLEDRNRFIARHAELVRVEESSSRKV